MPQGVSEEWCSRAQASLGSGRTFQALELHVEATEIKQAFSAERISQPATVVNPTFWGLSYTPWTIMCFALDHQPLGLQWTQTLQGVPDLDHSTVLLAAVPWTTTPNGGPLKQYFKDTVGHAC